MALDTGVIGLGNIGGGVARNLATAGHGVVGFDLDPDRITDAGAQEAIDAAEVAERSDLVVLAVATLPAWRASLAAISASGRRGLIVVDLCTFPLAEKETAHEELARVGIYLLDCPVSGARPQAETGELAMLVINLMISIQNLACAEAFLLARKAGLDLQQMADAVMDSAAYSKIFEVRAQKWITGDYEDPTAELAIQLKDKDVIRDFAADLDCPTPLFDATMPYYIAAASQGRSKEDAASILAVLEAMVGIPRD